VKGEKLQKLLQSKTICKKQKSDFKNKKKLKKDLRNKKRNTRNNTRNLKFKKQEEI